MALPDWECADRSQTGSLNENTVEEITRYAGKGNNQPLITNQPFKTTYRLRKIGGEWRLLVPSTPMPKESSQ